MTPLMIFMLACSGFCCFCAGLSAARVLDLSRRGHSGLATVGVGVVVFCLAAAAGIVSAVKIN